MGLSARNQLRGTVKSLIKGDVMAEVTIDLAGAETVVAAITRGSAESLHLKPGDEVSAVIKATDVMVLKE
jgi:molybdopterin-binding protein